LGRAGRKEKGRSEAGLGLAGERKEKKAWLGWAARRKVRKKKKEEWAGRN
jgi:hypothetical protein